MNLRPGNEVRLPSSQLGTVRRVFRDGSLAILSHNGDELNISSTYVTPTGRDTPTSDHDNALLLSATKRGEYELLEAKLRRDARRQLQVRVKLQRRNVARNIGKRAAGA